MPLEIIRGDTRKIQVTFKQANGSAYDISGGKVFFTVNPQAKPTDESQAVITKDVTSHTDPAQGQTEIVLTPQDTKVAPKNYWYDIQLVDTVGNVLSKKSDRLNVVADITQRVE